MSNTAIKADERKAKILAFIKDDLETEGNLKNSGLEMLKTGAFALAGAGVGAAIGKPSLVVGLGVILAGHYYKSSKISALGTGILATGSYKAAKGINGTEVDGLEGAKERLKAFGKDLKERLYIDKIKSMVSNKKTDTTEGVGNVTYFNPNSALDMGSLDAIEQEIQRHAEQFERKQMEGTSDYLSEKEASFIY